MSGLAKKPMALVVVVLVLALGAFVWTRYRSSTAPNKENSIQLTEEQLRQQMRR